jgi:proline iminopeptidase
MFSDNLSNRQKRAEERDMSEIKEGRLLIDKAGNGIFYKLFGQGSQTLVGLHGGPGADHRYLIRLGELATGDLQVLLYDQLGSGKSDRPDEPSLWTVPRFVDELETIRRGLGLGRIHLFGQSWGGMLALQYTLDYPEGVKSLILSNTTFSIPEAVRGLQRRRMELPTEVFMKLLKYEASGDFESPQMAELVLEFYARFIRRSTPFHLETSIKECKEILMPLLDNLGPAYKAMWGPFEFLVTGTLLDWDVTDRLSEIKVPTLIVCGWHDEAVSEIHRTLADRIPDNEFVIFGNSSHMIILEKEADAYLSLIKNFVDRVIARS